MDRELLTANLAKAGLEALRWIYGEPGWAAFEDARSTPPGILPKRQYGNSDIQLSIVGMGGLVVSGIPQQDANNIVAWCIDRGINYFDVAPTYGNAEERLGPALQPFRDQVFLACKTTERDAAGARAELESSLHNLRTDHFDLYQLHGLSTLDETKTALGPAGALETAIKARDAGLIRHIGFSAHSAEAALFALDSFHFDSILFPFNAVCMENEDFGPEVIAKAQATNTARLALKAMAWKKREPAAERDFPKCWYEPVHEPELARLMLSYTLSLPVTAIVPPSDERLFRLGVELALKYEPLTPEEQKLLTDRLAGTNPIF